MYVLIFFSPLMVTLNLLPSVSGYLKSSSPSHLISPSSVVCRLDIVRLVGVNIALPFNRSQYHIRFITFLSMSFPAHLSPATFHTTFVSRYIVIPWSHWNVCSSPSNNSNAESTEITHLNKLIIMRVMPLFTRPLVNRSLTIVKFIESQNGIPRSCRWQYVKDQEVPENPDMVACSLTILQYRERLTTYMMLAKGQLYWVPNPNP